MGAERPAADPVFDPAVAAAIAAALAADDAPEPWDPDPYAHKDFGYPLSTKQGELLYVLARAIGATRVVEFATSIGISTIYLAAAVRDNGGGVVIGSEIVDEKVAIARRNVTAAGLGDFVEIRPGDALSTLVDVGGPVDLVLLDGWPTGAQPSIDRRVLDLLVPQMRPGALLVDDNGEPDVIAYLRDPAGPFRSVDLVLDRGATEIAVKVR